ncbi:fibronectin type III domain-containing protein [uncultured Enterococcus sp.]|uniref:fibronectin type III domain-containing protein n=2 Tax=uncultured Enterococcus sp. TaxID=167972 RepID=UPI00258CC269|nr:fibronectin type III domain-containing protein [uncultured Enterococcus sp.]
MKKFKGIMSLVTLLIMTVSSLGIPAEVFAADSDKPENLTVKYNNEQNWTTVQFDKVADAESYNVYRGEEQDGEFEKIASLKSDKTFTVDDYMTLKVAGTIKSDYLYYYKVAAVVDGKEADAAGPIANQDVAKKENEEGIDAAAEAPQVEIAESEEAEEDASSRIFGSFKHKTGCDTKHSGSGCNSYNKHDSHCDRNHSKYRKCNSNNWKHGDHCDKNHSGKNCNENNWKHKPDCDKNHSGKNCNENNWKHKPDCDEKHSGKDCNHNWKHGEHCDKNHSGKHCNENNYKEKWDAVKNVCVTETQHHWLKLSWESKGSDAEYKIYRAVNKCNDYNSGNFKEIATVKGQTTYNDIKLDHNTTYCYKVMVRRPKTCPYTIETVSSSNIGKFTVCGKTLNPSIKASAVSERAIKVTWTNTKSDNGSTRYAISYTLYRSTTNNINNATAITVNGRQDGSEMSYLDDCLNQCTTYYYWVKANYGQWSSWVSPQWGPSCATTLKKKEIGTGLKGCIKNYLVCGCIPTRYYGAQIFLGTQNPSTLDYSKVRVYRRTASGGYGSAYTTIDVCYAKYMNGAFGKGYYLDYTLSKVCLSRGTYYFAIQAVGTDCGKEITGPMKEIGCVTVRC